MPKIAKTKQELEDELVEQMQALRSSLANYDSGEKWEAKRIATSLYTLCHDGSGRSKSLFGMLGLKSKLRCISSYAYPELDPPPPGIEYVGDPIYPIPTPLVMLHGSGEFRPVWETDGPVRKADFPRKSFTSWWEETIFAPSSGIEMSRKNMIFRVRNKDGGGHVDDHLDDLNYKILKTVGTPNITITQTVNGVSGEPKPGGNIVWPIMRQIGWELDQSAAAQGI
jgi:hypothetical protein